MKTRELGRSGLRVSMVGLGCMGMSEFYGASDDAESLKTLHHALNVGMNFWDTADMYGSGANERLLAHVLQERRDEVVLATKFGILRGADGTFVGISGRPEYVHQACDRSLERLGIDHIDLYYQHRVDPNVPIEDTVGAMAELVAAGKVRHLGLSEASPETLHRAAAVHPIAALQTEYSLWSRDVEERILATCALLGIGFVAYSPLGRGFLSGAISSPDDLAEDDWRRNNPRFQGENFALNLRLVEQIRALAEEKGCTPSQLGTGLGAAAKPAHRADSGDSSQREDRRERWRHQGPAVRRGPRTDRSGDPARPRGRPPLPRARHGTAGRLRARARITPASRISPAPQCQARC